MGWTAVTNNFDWSAVGVVQEYVKALRERLEAVNCPRPPPDIPAAGDDVQAAAFWSTLQKWIDYWGAAPRDCKLYEYFIDRNAWESGFDGEPVLVFFTESTWRQAAGIPDGFRRVPTSKTVLASGVYDPETGETAITATGAAFEEDHVGGCLSVLQAGGDFGITAFEDSTHVTVMGDATCDGSRFSILPDDWTNYADPAFEHGHMEEGDVIGPWVFADLQAALNPLVWVGYDPDCGYMADFGMSAESALLANNGESDIKEDRQAAIDEAEERFLASAGSNQCGLTAGCVVAAGGGVYKATVERWSMYVYFETASEKSCDVDWYARANRDAMPLPSAWDRQGDFDEGYVEDTLYRWLTDAGVSGLRIVSSTYYGPDDLPPNWPQEDDVHLGYYSDETRAGAAVAKWNVPGGFEFVG